MNSSLTHFYKHFNHKISLYCAMLILFSQFLFLAISAHADEFDDDEADVVKVYLKKIRDNEGNYLANVTRATSRSISKGGEFSVSKYSKNKYKSGPIISVNAPVFDFSPHKEGMSTTDMATVGLETLASIGDIFGHSDKAEKLRETNYQLQDSKDMLDQMSDDVELLVTMTSEVELYDEANEVEIRRSIKFEYVFPSKIQFAKQKEKVIEEEVTAAIKLVLLEYIEEI